MGAERQFLPLTMLPDAGDISVKRMEQGMRTAIHGDVDQSSRREAPRTDNFEKDFCPGSLSRLDVGLGRPDEVGPRTAVKETV